MSENKGRVLIVDDSEMNRALLSDILGDEYEVMEAENGVEAMSLLNLYHSEMTLMFLDLVMPEMDGFEVLAAMNKTGWINELPVIIISSEDSYTYVDHAYSLGAAEYIKRPFDEKMVKHRVQNTIMLYKKQHELESMVIDQMLEAERSNLMMVDILSHIVEFRNGESGMHVLHIRVLTEALLERLAQITDQYDLTPEKIAIITNASSLHDIGKIGIPEQILNKPGRLTPEERLVMQRHSELGAEMLEQIPNYRDEELVHVAHDICRWHHERYDGGGYPDGLKGEEIPISAQVVALADVYDALTSERVYKPAYSHDKAMEMILGGECGAFSPLLLQCLRESGEYLAKELKVNSIGARAQQELNAVPKNLLKSGGTSGRKLQALELERTKRRFFASISQDVQFEYEYSYEVISLSKIGAAKLGLPEVITKPWSNAAFIEVVGKDNFEDLATALTKATPEQPMVEREYTFKVFGAPKRFKVTARPLWSIDNGVLTCSVGQFSEIKE